ncbi:MAG: fibronectin type III domain-containing protein, partial [Bacillota bacterium]|nr:fibronectin type III domain-containing protein [Bacillota bacterium]
LMAAIFDDQEFASDYVANFDAFDKKVKTGEAFDLTLTRYQAKAFFDNNVVAIPDADVGIWKDGEVQDIGTTDENGKVQLSFDEPGTYIVTAAGSIEDTVVDYSISVDEDMNGFDYGIKYDTDSSGFNMLIPYTMEDYGDGPYPADELQWIDYMDFDEDDYEGYLLYSNELLCDCWTMTPACIVKVYDVMPAEPAEVAVTVNNKGVLAAAKDGSAMADKKVTVEDINEDGHLTINEALAAMHEAYYEGGAAGFAVGGMYNSIQKLWGVETTNVLTYLNGTGIFSVDDEIKAGDEIYTSVNADDVYYADWYIKFSKKNYNTTKGTKISVKLTGHYGMAYEEEDLKDVPVEGIQIGTWQNGEFVPIEGAVTDANGKAELSFDEVGEYVITAKGTVKDEVQDWSQGGAIVEADCPTMAPAGIVNVEDGEEDAYVAAMAKDKQAAIDELAKADFSDLNAEGQLNAAMANIAAIAKINAAKTKDELAAAIESAQATMTVVTTKIEGFSAKKGKKKATVKWTKDANNTFDGYEVYYKRVGKKAETFVEVSDPDTTSIVIKKLTKKKKYTFKVRGYKMIDDQPVYGPWSAAKTIKIK